MNTQKNQASAERCNKCGKAILIENGIPKEGVVSFSANWGYFSRKDGEHHSFCLCEDCYDEFVKGFEIPAAVCEKTELL